VLPMSSTLMSTSTCFMRFRAMFHRDVACVSFGCCKSRGVAYVAIAIHVRCKCMFQIF
jgi:hypothetical protein